MYRKRLGMVGTLVVGATLSTLALSSSAGARALRRELTVFQTVQYTLLRSTGLTEWKMSSPGKALEVQIYVKSNAPSVVRIHGAEHTLNKGTFTRFATNRSLGKRPFRTPFKISIADERGRTSGTVKYLK